MAFCAVTCYHAVQQQESFVYSIEEQHLQPYLVICNHTLIPLDHGPMCGVRLPNLHPCTRPPPPRLEPERLFGAERPNRAGGLLAAFGRSPAVFVCPVILGVSKITPVQCTRH